MSTTAISGASDCTRRWGRSRFRFNLKSLFILMTVVCLWLGYLEACRQREGQIRRRHLAFATAIDRNASVPPTGTSFAMPRGQSWRGTTRTDGRGLYCNSTRRIRLLVGEQLAASDDSEVAAQLAKHYGRNLERIGLNPAAEPAANGESSARAAWQSRRYGMAIEVDVRVAGTSGEKHAEIALVLIHKEKSRLW